MLNEHSIQVLNYFGSVNMFTLNAKLIKFYLLNCIYIASIHSISHLKALYIIRYVQKPNKTRVSIGVPLSNLLTTMGRYYKMIQND